LETRKVDRLCGLGLLANVGLRELFRSCATFRYGVQRFCGSERGTLNLTTIGRKLRDPLGNYDGQ
jgi:hypothetical protein